MLLTLCLLLLHRLLLRLMACKQLRKFLLLSALGLLPLLGVVRELLWSLPTDIQALCRHLRLPAKHENRRIGNWDKEWRAPPGRLVVQ